MATNSFGFEDEQQRKQKKLEDEFKARKQQLELASATAAKPAAVVAEAPAPAGDGLQFDRAEFSAQPAAGGVACAECKAPIAGDYYKVNSNVVCRSCGQKVLAATTGGSPGRRLLRATIFGGVAALVGAGIYWAILAATGYEVGLISILVGAMVGSAVKAGCDGRGGLGYQCLAVFLTYSAIVSAYVPLLVAEASRQFAAREQAENPAATAKPGVQPASTAPTTADAAVANDHDEFDSASIGEPPSVFGIMVALLMMVAFIYAIPFLSGLQNILGLLIIGFGLWQAWSINSKPELKVEGPYNLATAPPPNAGA